jgi:hypothetical protein
VSGGQDSRDITVGPAPGDDADGAPSSSAPSSRDGRTWTPDLDGLLCALVLAPGTYSRNRFFRMFEDAGARRARRRATHVRSVLRSLRDRGRADDVLPETEPGRVDDVEISFHVPTLGMRRTTRLSPIELALVRYALKVGSDAARAHDKSTVEGALARLAPGV